MTMLEESETAQEGANLAAEIVDLLDLPLMALDARYEVCFVNRSAERMLGYGEGELQGMPLARLSEVVAMQLSGLSRRQTPRQILCRINRKDGASMPVRIEARPLRPGGPDALLVLRDAREGTALPERPTTSSQLATLGRIATGIVHQLEQPLSVVRMATASTLSLVEDGETDPDFLRGQLGLVAGQTHRMAKIVDHMRVFARIERIEPVTFDIAESVRSALSLVERDFLRCGIATTLQVPEECPPAFGLPLRLEQVLVNLFTNAREAIVQSATPPEHHEPAGEPAGNVCVAVEAADQGLGQGIRIRVRDSGPGIPERHLSRIFDPFFTTRPARGTGLGLTICAALVADMGGSIAARNAEAGAEFTILMPVRAATEQHPAASEPQGP